MLPAEIGEPGGVMRHRRARQLALDLLEPRERLREEVAEAQLSLPYFWRKRSTRPAVSMSFCFPV